MDDRGNATLYVVFIVAAAFLIISWMFMQPAMNIIISTYNGFIGEGWVSVQSGQTMSIVQYAWGAVPFIGLVILAAIVVIRAFIMHDGGS